MKSKPKIAIVRGKFLNAYEMQIFTPLIRDYNLTAFASLRPFHEQYPFPLVKLPSPMDLPDFPYKMSLLNRFFIDAHYLWGLERKLKGFDLVHTAETYYHYTQQALRAKKQGYVKHVIATVLENIPFNNEGIRGRKSFKTRARKELDHLIALTNLTKQALIMEGCDPSKITVIGHGIDTRRFKPAVDLRHRLGAKQSLFRILFTGRLESYKGIFDLLRAAKILLSDSDLRQYHLQFIFVGDGSEKNHLIQEARLLGIDRSLTFERVSYSEMPKVYQQAEIFTAPSKPRTTLVQGRSVTTWLEQYNTCLLEAQASGLPIVTTSSGGIPENLGSAGLLVDPGDVKALTRALKSLLLSSRLRLTYAQKARDRAEKVHDNRLIAGKLAKLYTFLLS